jgi:hypothetical protein
MTMSHDPSCISCGMPLRTPADHAAGDTSKTYCRFCARPDGSMKSYEEALVGITGFLRKTQGLDEDVALTAAKQMMAQLPAWSKRAS